MSWSARRAAAVVAIAAVGLLLGGAMAPIAQADTTATTSSEAPVRVIVQLRPGADPSAIIAAHGGTIVRTLSALQSVVVDVPPASLIDLHSASEVVEVTEDSGLELATSEPAAALSSDDVASGKANPIQFVESDYGESDTVSQRSFDSFTTDEVAEVIGASELHATGVTGEGVDVAVIDTGIAPVDGLATVVNGPDLSFDSQDPALHHLDANGHGTHLAGIISGLAPDSRLVNVKVGAGNGAVDVSQVIAAIDWVIQHRNDNGLDIRVLNLSYGTQNTQDHRIDPLSYAVEVAWKHGIVVVTAAGNGGSTFDRLTNPAVNPYVLAVGASEAHGTHSTTDDTVAPFSSRSANARNVDLVAPGRSVVSLRTPGSYLDSVYPEGRVDATSFRGSGTSQSAAVVSAAAALLLEAQPNLTPDQVKAALTTSAKNLPLAGNAQGSGILAVDKALKRTASSNDVTQTWPAGTGTGTLEGARGSSHVEMDGVPLTGEMDIFGTSWSGTSWSGTSWSGTSWSGGDWNGTSWSGTSWSGTSWSGTSWSGTSWSGTSWSGTSWSGTSWSGTSWSGTSWSGTSWSGTSWSGTSWSGTSWSSIDAS